MTVQQKSEISWQSHSVVQGVKNLIIKNKFEELKIYLERWVRWSFSEVSPLFKCCLNTYVNRMSDKQCEEELRCDNFWHKQLICKKKKQVKKQRRRFSYEQRRLTIFLFIVRNKSICFIFLSTFSLRKIKAVQFCCHALFFYKDAHFCRLSKEYNTTAPSTLGIATLATSSSSRFFTR